MQLTAQAPTTLQHAPIGDGLTIRPSTIEGLGLYTAEVRPARSLFGFSHVFTDDPLLRTIYPDGWVRSPWGSWYNMDPEHHNVESAHHGNRQKPQVGDYKVLFSTVYITAGTELITSEYSLYEPGPTTFRPLPPGLTIKETGYGIGLFATQHFPAGHNFGRKRVYSDEDMIKYIHSYRNGWVHSPWGAIVRSVAPHEEPSCYLEGGGASEVFMLSGEDISPDMEITVRGS